MKRTIFIALSLMILQVSFASSQEMIKSISVHDPVMIKQDSSFYLFATGNGIAVWSSPDMKNWKAEKPVFAAPPQWAVDTIPGFKGHIWAPDISYHAGTYYLYYSVSAFGKNTSAIGVATNKTLKASDPNYKWVDHGRVIQSYPGITNFNAIDPNLITDKSGVPYLSFGSFWDGLKLVKLSSDRLSIAEDVNQFPTIASRKKSSGLPNPPAISGNPVDAGGNAIEAPFIYKKDKYYYLFVSSDYCCKGIKSDYKMLVGRSKNLKGPYLDKEGMAMQFGGGSLLLAGDKNWHGVGHNAVIAVDKDDFLIFHGYDALDKGKAKLLVKRLEWKNAWPAVIP